MRDYRYMFKSTQTKELEEQLYAKVASEIQNATIDQGTWARALAESDGVQERTQAKYIQLRVAKLKDNYFNEAYKERQQKDERMKDDQAITIIRTVPKRNSYRFKLFSVALFSIGAICLFLSALFDPINSSGDTSYFILYFFMGAILVPLSFYSFYQSFQIEKISKTQLVYQKTTRLFWIMIPTSLLVTAVGALSIIIGLLAFIGFIQMCSDANKYGQAYNRALRRNLL